MHLGDFRLGDTIDFKFTTITSAGAAITLAGSPAAACYPGNSTTEITAGITLSVDFDARTGLHNVRIVASSGNGYATATNYAVVLTAGTVDGTSVVGYVVAHFSVENHSALRPATAGRQLAVEADGMAHADVKEWLGAAPNALQSGRVDGYLGAAAAGVIAAATFAAGALDAVWSTAARTLTGFGTLAADVWAAATRRLTDGTNIVLAKGTGVTGFNDLSAAQVNTEVDTALTDIHLDHLLAADYDPGSKPGVATALLNELVESDAGVSRFTANALEQAPSGGGGVADWTAGEREQIRHRLGIDGTAAAPAATPSLATAAAVDDVPTNAELAAALAGLNNLSAADIRTAVGLATNNLDAQLAAKSTSAEVAAVAAAIAALPNAAAIVTALLDAADAIETGVTPRIALRSILAMVAGIITGAETTTPTIMNPAGTATRVQMTTDADGNRSNVVLT